MQGKTVLITGGTAGIGKRCALELLQLGADVTIVGRNPEKTTAVVQELEGLTGRRPRAALCDLASLASIRQLGAELARTHPRLDVLLNNAGAYQQRRVLSVDGFELTFAVNHLAYFLLTQLSLPLLAKSPSARVVSVSSSAHAAAGQLDFDDLQGEHGWFSWKAYAHSKLANVLFARELAKRLQGRKITSNTLHPGFVASEFLNKGGVWKLLMPMANVFAMSEPKGARTSVFLASSPTVEGVTGEYFNRCKVTRPSRPARDDAAAARLWEVSASLVKLEKHERFV